MAATATKKMRSKKQGQEMTNGHGTNGYATSTGSSIAQSVGNANGNGIVDAVCRTTAVFPAVLNVNWELCALKKGLPKNEVLTIALSAYLKAEGFEPDRLPKFDVSY